MKRLLSWEFGCTKEIINSFLFTIFKYLYVTIDFFVLPVRMLYVLSFVPPFPRASTWVHHIGQYSTPKSMPVGGGTRFDLFLRHPWTSHFFFYHCDLVFLMIRFLTHLVRIWCRGLGCTNKVGILQYENEVLQYPDPTLSGSVIPLFNTSYH